jgi:hypothetical protein
MTNSKFQRYFWTTLWITGGIVLGIIFVVFYAYKENLNEFLLLLWSFAYIAIGGLTGFIFSVPKIITGTSSSFSSDSDSRKSSLNKIQENTNLTEISDWLTKILIGAGLVELKEIPKFIMHIAKIMAQGIRKFPNQNNIINSTYLIDSVTIMSVAIILYFITWGFISGYLVMKLVLTEQFALTDNNE